MSDRDHGPEMMIGGLLLIIFLGMFLIKALKQLMDGLGAAFLSFANMAGSFAVVLFGIGKIVLLAAAIVGLVVAAVYFTYKYVRMVKRATEVMNYCDERVRALEGLVERNTETLNSLVKKELLQMSQRLETALSKPKLLPEATVPKEEAGRSDQESDSSKSNDKQSPATGDPDDGNKPAEKLVVVKSFNPY